MASGVNVKMGVDGLSQFKNNMNQAKQAVKTLDAQLALTEKQFKQTGDSEDYMTMKSELLKAKLEQQKTVLNNAEKALEDMRNKGVDRASKSYQDLYRQMLQAKGEIIDTENAMNGVASAGQDAADNVDQMNYQLKRVGDGVSWQNVTTGLQSITGKLERAGKAAFSMGQRLIQATLSKGQWADELRTNAQVLGLTDDELQRMQKTSLLIDTSVEAIVGAKKRLKKGFAEKGKETMGAFEALGINPNMAKDAEDLFWKTGEAIMKFGDEYEKESYAQRLFGRSWNELIPLFQAGREEYEKTNAGWNVLSEEQLDSLTKMDDQYQKLTQAWEDFQTQILTAFSGPLTQGMESITGLFEELNKYLQTEQGQAMLKQMGDTVSGLIEDLVNINPADVVGGLQSVINGITESLKWIEKHKDDVKLALEIIGGGFVALKVGSIAADVWKAVDGFRALLGFNGGGDGTGGTGGGGDTTTTGSALGTGAKVLATKAGTMAAGFMLKSGMLLPAVGDRLLNETNAGRAVRDGGDVLYGLQQDIQEFTDGVKENADTFAQDWQNNNIVKFFEWLGENWKENGENTAQFWAGQAKNWNLMGENTYGDDWTIADALEDAAGKMDKAATELAGENGQQQGTTEMTQAAKDMGRIPGAMEQAVRDAMSKIGITIDGAVLIGYITDKLATSVLGN